MLAVMPEQAVPPWGPDARRAEASRTEPQQMRLSNGGMAARSSEGSIKWQLCYDISARTWWMVSLDQLSSRLLPPEQHRSSSSSSLRHFSNSSVPLCAPLAALRGSVSSAESGRLRLRSPRPLISSRPPHSERLRRFGPRKFGPPRRATLGQRGQATFDTPSLRVLGGGGSEGGVWWGG